MPNEVWTRMRPRKRVLDGVRRRPLSVEKSGGHGERRSRAYNGGLGWNSQQGPGVQSPWSGVQGKAFNVWTSSRSRRFLIMHDFVFYWYYLHFYCILLYTCAYVLCIKLLVTYLLFANSVSLHHFYTVFHKKWTLCYFIISFLWELRIAWKFPEVYRRCCLLW